MTFVAVEFYNGVNNTNVLGFLRTPTGFNPRWHLGFREYLKEKYEVKGSIRIYPLNIHLNSDTMGKTPLGYKNMEDDFNLALRSNIYYPESDPDSESIRRQWAQLDPESPDFHVKER